MPFTLQTQNATTSAVNITKKAHEADFGPRTNQAVHDPDDPPASFRPLDPAVYIEHAKQCRYTFLGMPFLRI